MANLQFKKAIKFDAKGRVALVGPAGSGKSMTSLRIARALAGPNGKIAAVDTEHGSLSKYAPGEDDVVDDETIFDFDTLPLTSYSPQNFLGALRAAEENNYDVFITDSLSHFWVGKDGALEFVDMASKRHRDQMGGWKDFRPHEREMVDAMLASPCHIICTMRAKTEYVEELNQQGKKVRRKVGLQPVQREGLEYEFDLVAYMDDENTFITDKTRCSYYARKAITQPSAKDFDEFRRWLKGAKRESEQVPVDPKLQSAIGRIEEAAKHFKEFGEEGQRGYQEVLASHGTTVASGIKTIESAGSIYRALTARFNSLTEQQKASAA
jgi:energy-coupling factor transporter ATP-binding protein EcfA2